MVCRPLVIGVVIFGVACSAFDEDEERPRANTEQWFDWECDGGTLIVLDASPPVEASVIEDGCR